MDLIINANNGIATDKPVDDPCGAGILMGKRGCVLIRRLYDEGLLESLLEDSLPAISRASITLRDEDPMPSLPIKRH